MTFRPTMEFGASFAHQIRFQASALAHASGAARAACRYIARPPQKSQGFVSGVSSRVVGISKHLGEVGWQWGLDEMIALLDNADAHTRAG
jgi:hypothetical protein